MSSNYTLSSQEYVQVRYGYQYDIRVVKVSFNDPIVANQTQDDIDNELYELLKAYKEYADWKELIDLVNDISEKGPEIEELI